MVDIDQSAGEREQVERSFRSACGQVGVDHSACGQVVADRSGRIKVEDACGCPKDERSAGEPV